VGRAAVVAVLALLLAGFAGGCGDADDPAIERSAAPKGAVELTVLYDDGSGRKATGTLTCRGATRSAAGALDGKTPPAKLCAQASAIADMLTSDPEKGRVCTQIYGGPETARVTGTIDGEKVDRRFRRTNGCEIADYTRAAGLLAQP